MTPGQYLSGVRFFEAKRLLLTTSLTVSNSVGRVGYTSVGTFTSKFTRAVGMSPTHYRHPEVRRAMLAISPEFQRLPALDLIRRARTAEGVRRLGAGAVDCAIELPRSAGRVHVLAGLFTDPIPQRAPVAYRAGSGADAAEMAIQNVPAGRWTVIVVACRAGTGPHPRLLGSFRRRVEVTPGHATRVTAVARPDTARPADRHHPERADPVAAVLRDRGEHGGLIRPGRTSVPPGDSRATPVASGAPTRGGGVFRRESARPTGEERSCPPPAGTEPTPASSTNREDDVPPAAHAESAQQVTESSGPRRGAPRRTGPAVHDPPERGDNGVPDAEHGTARTARHPRSGGPTAAPSLTTGPVLSADSTGPVDRPPEGGVKTPDEATTPPGATRGPHRPSRTGGGSDAPDRFRHRRLLPPKPPAGPAAAAVGRGRPQRPGRGAGRLAVVLRTRRPRHRRQRRQHAAGVRRQGDADQRARGGHGLRLRHGTGRGVHGLQHRGVRCDRTHDAHHGPRRRQGETVPASGIAASLRPIGWLCLGAVVVSAGYGVVGVLVGDRLPQLSEATLASGVPVRLLQASIVFGVIGLAFSYLGLAALRLVPGPLRALPARFPNARSVVIGALIGGFLIGRPFPLFRAMFEYAVETANPLYGAGVFVLQSLGNITVVAVLFPVLVHGSRGRFVNWLTAKPARLATVTAVAFITVGVFTVLYWDLRVPSRYGFGWYPAVDWG